MSAAPSRSVCTRARGRAAADKGDRRLLLAAYGLVLLAPIALMAAVAKAGAQGWLVVVADGMGFAGLSLLALQIVGSGRSVATTKTFGLQSVLSLHRRVGVAVLVLVVLHVVLLVVDDPERLALLDPRTAPGRARAGTLALLGLMALAATSVWRARLRLSYERWRAVHIACTALVVAATFAHVVWVSAYTASPLLRWTILGLVLAAAGALFWIRVARPYVTALRPYLVSAVKRERGDAVTLQLVADGHEGVRFRPGQFARIRVAHSAYGMDDHPFSFSSSARRPDRPEFTVKALGDFSGSLADLRVGTRVLVDGPHGESVRGARGGGRILVAAGIGITPALSVLRTAAEQGDRRPFLLLYGSRRWSDVTFREELDELERRLPDLRVVHVLSRPDATWRGERGRLDEGVLRRHAPADLAAWSALLCGPRAMVTDAGAALRRLGVPRAAIQAEGFE